MESSGGRARGCWRDSALSAMEEAVPKQPSALLQRCSWRGWGVQAASGEHQAFLLRTLEDAVRLARAILVPWTGDVAFCRVANHVVSMCIPKPIAVLVFPGDRMRTSHASERTSTSGTPTSRQAVGSMVTWTRIISLASSGLGSMLPPIYLRCVCPFSFEFFCLLQNCQTTVYELHYIAVYGGPVR